MQLPEVQLKKILDGILLAIRKDTIAYAATETNSYLYRLLNGNVSEKWDHYTQGKEIFNRAVDHPRIIETRIFFDRTRANLPTVHITLPNLQAGNDGIGMDEGYIEPYGVQSGDDPDFIYTVTPVYTRSFQTTYHMIITSDNAFEVLTMYHVVKAALIANIESLEYYGLKNIKFSGQDLQINDTLVPPGIFSRGIGLNLIYEADIPLFRNIPNVLDIKPITGTPIEIEEGAVGGLPEVVIDPPTNLVVTSLSPTTIGLGWINNADGDPIIIERSTNGNFWYQIKRTDRDIAIYTDEDLIEGTRYFYRARHFVYANYSAYSNVDDARPMPVGSMAIRNFWVGTTIEYVALVVYDDETLYVIQD